MRVNTAVQDGGAYAENSHVRIDEEIVVSVKSSSSSRRHNKTLKVSIFGILLVALGITCITPPYPEQMILQHIGTLLLIVPIFCDCVKNRMSLFSYLCLACFTLLHVIGARWIYSYVPYKEWLDALGVSFDFLKDPRNHYDRMVHFSFGMMMFPWLLSLTRKWVESKPLVAIFVAWLFIQAGSMVYEVFEWQLSVWCEGGDAYNGQQGDMWDAQKDMALALIGSTMIAISYAIKNKVHRSL